MTIWRRLIPDGLAGRFALLLATAVVLANIVALGVLVFARARLGSAANDEREVERAVSLVPAIEAAPVEARDGIARSASTRSSRLSIDPAPIVETRPTAPRSAALTRDLDSVLPDRDVRAAIVVRPARGDDHAARETVAVSIRLNGGDVQADQWLNVVSSGMRQRPPGIQEEAFVLILGLSLVSVLGGGLLFVRRLTRPLSDLAEATRAAGQGDRTVQVSEVGPLEMREAARAFNDMQTRIHQFDAERMRSLAAVGHDLRTPITSLRIRAELLDPKDAAPMIRTLDEMAVMADGLVAYAKGAGDSETFEEIDLAALLTDLCAERGAMFDGGPSARVTGKPVALRRAIGNLIDNALQYAGDCHVRLSQDCPDAKVIVEDDGPGLPEDQLAAVFEPFARGEDSRSTETGGAGLGLSIARNLALAHGGAVHLENRQSAGLRAVLTLPLRTPS